MRQIKPKLHKHRAETRQLLDQKASTKANDASVWKQIQTQCFRECMRFEKIAYQTG